MRKKLTSLAETLGALSITIAAFLATPVAGFAVLGGLLIAVGVLEA